METLYPALVLGTIGIVELHTEVETKDNIGKVESNTKTCIKSELLIEAIKMKDLLWITILSITDIPHITNIKKERTIQNPP